MSVGVTDADLAGEDEVRDVEAGRGCRAPGSRGWPCAAGRGAPGAATEMPASVSFGAAVSTRRTTSSSGELAPGRLRGPSARATPRWAAAHSTVDQRARRTGRRRRSRSLGWRSVQRDSLGVELGHDRGGPPGVQDGTSAKPSLRSLEPQRRAVRPRRGVRRPARPSVCRSRSAGDRRARRERVRAPRSRACGSGSRTAPPASGCSRPRPPGPRPARSLPLRSGAAIHAVAKLGSGPGSTWPSATIRRAATKSSSSRPSAGVTGQPVSMIARSALASSTATLHRRSKPVGATQNDWWTGRAPGPTISSRSSTRGWRRRSWGSVSSHSWPPSSRASSTTRSPRSRRPVRTRPRSAAGSRRSGGIDARYRPGRSPAEGRPAGARFRWPRGRPPPRSRSTGRARREAPAGRGLAPRSRADPATGRPTNGPTRESGRRPNRDEEALVSDTVTGSATSAAPGGPAVDPDALLAEILTTPEGRADPYPRYAAIREHSAAYRTSIGFVVVARFDDCQWVLRDARFGKGDAASVAMWERYGLTEEEWAERFSDFDRRDVVDARAGPARPHAAAPPGGEGVHPEDGRAAAARRRPAHRAAARRVRGRRRRRRDPRARARGCRSR